MLFADIRGSMELIEDLDPEEARAILRQDWDDNESARRVATETGPE